MGGVGNVGGVSKTMTACAAAWGGSGVGDGFTVAAVWAALTTLTELAKNVGVGSLLALASLGGVEMGLQKRRCERLTGGGGMGRRQHGRLVCVVFWLRPTEAQACGGVGSLPLAWASCVCVFCLRPAAAWAIA